MAQEQLEGYSKGNVWLVQSSNNNKECKKVHTSYNPIKVEAIIEAISHIQVETNIRTKRNFNASTFSIECSISVLTSIPRRWF